MVIIVVMVKELCEMIGVGMMDVKKVLIEIEGDMDVVIDWLCIKGLVKVVKKVDRVVVEGLIGVVVSDGCGVVIEINLEIDFVVKNVDFQLLVVEVVKVVLQIGDLVEVVKVVDLNGEIVDIVIINVIVCIGENMIFCWMYVLEGDIVVFYVYNVVIEGMGKIGVLVVLNGLVDKVQVIGK